MRQIEEIYDADDDEISTLNRQNRNNSSPVLDLSELYAFIYPKVTLFRTDKESQSTQFEILLEEYLPIIKRLPPPIVGPPSILTEHDGEITSEMLLKISITGFIRNIPTIDPARLLNHLYSFPYSCRVINHETLNQVELMVGIFATEADMTLIDFLHKTAHHPRFNYQNSWYYLDQFLMGNTN